jgi:hypothetical protein
MRAPGHSAAWADVRIGCRARIRRGPGQSRQPLVGGSQRGRSRRRS